MRVREVILEDGRRLWFYEFDDEPGLKPGSGDAGEGRAHPPPMIGRPGETPD